MSGNKNINMKSASEILHIEATTGWANETLMASAYFQWAHNTYIDDLHGLLFHVPNETERLQGETSSNHIRRIGALKAQGLTPGIQDLIYLGEPVKNRPPVLIEFKLPRWTTSPAQDRIHARHLAAGYETHIVRDFNHFRHIIEKVILK